MAWQGFFDSVFSNDCTIVAHAPAWSGGERRRGASRGAARQGFLPLEEFVNTAQQSPQAWCGRPRPGEARPGTARRGTAWHWYFDR